MVDDPLKNLGERFKKARLRLAISPEELAEKTRIPIRYIENIEKAKRDDLPEEAYLMGYLNKISKVLKLKDPQQVMNDYKQEEGQYVVQSILNENHIKEDDDELSSGFFKLYYLYILIALVLLLTVFYIIGTSPE